MATAGAVMWRPIQGACIATVLAAVSGCSDGARDAIDSGGADAGSTDAAAVDVADVPDQPACQRAADADVGPVLEVRFLGVGGFSFRVGDDQVLTAPLYTNPGFATVFLDEIRSDHALIDALLDDELVEDARAILVGHAHYDHLLDVPYIWTKTADAMIYGNLSMQRILNGFAPDPGPTCEPPENPTWALVPRENVVALNDPDADRVDSRNCAGREVCGGEWSGEAGEWVSVPGTSVRIRALCSSHPAQFAGAHFGVGCVEEPHCEPSRLSDEWLEGATLAYLIDFLDPADGRPIFRVFYQDAPADAPVGYVPPDLLDDKRVDLAVMNVGSWEEVEDHPTAILNAMRPRYAVGSHWEDFFRPQTEPIQPIPLSAPIEDFSARMQAALSEGAAAPMCLNGEPLDVRHAVPMPGDDFLVVRDDAVAR